MEDVLTARSQACCIAFVPATQFSGPGEWLGWLDQAAALGFDTVLLGCPFALGAGRRSFDPNLIGDFDSPSVGFALNQTPYPVAQRSADCGARGLELMLDIGLERACDTGGLLTALSPWALPRDIPIDPHAVHFGEAGIALPWHDPLLGTTLLAALEALLCRLGESGIRAFRLAGITAPSIEQLQQLVSPKNGASPERIFLAETEGLDRADLAGLRRVAWSGALGSLPWWDYRASWFLEECERLRELGRLILPVTTAHLAGDVAQPADLIRRVLSAAGLGDGMLVDGLMIQQAAEHLALMRALKHATQVLHSANGVGRAHLQRISAADAPLTVIRRWTSRSSSLTAINPTDSPQQIKAEDLTSRLPEPSAALTWSAPGEASGAVKVEDTLRLAEQDVRYLHAVAAAPVLLSTPSKQVLRRELDAAIASPRVAIEAIEPSCDGGRFPVRANAGSTLEVFADVFCDGHDVLAVYVQWRAVDETHWRETAMQLLDNDRFQGRIALDRLGHFKFRIAAFVDRFGTWLKDTGKKRDAGLDIALELMEGAALVEEYARVTENQGLQQLGDELKRPRGGALEADAFRRDVLFRPDTLALMHDSDPRQRISLSAEFGVRAERRAAHYASWYELFPRSMSAIPGKHGRLSDVVAHLPRVAQMGFDVLYFPPVHPIGLAHRKGKNNSLTPVETDPGSPYAIGSAEGGHDALHPELGTLDDFLALVDAAEEHGMEIALDFAIQCSPDHPWLRQHPAWFNFRPDGSIRHAENPPKKYEDIVNVDFYSDRADVKDKAPAAALWLALRDVVLFWAERKVRIFRVDNPHTKPLPFWEWMIDSVSRRFPDVIFLAEAFTAPKMMARLAKVGFTQSYSYFTWRNNKDELTSYLTELAKPPLCYVFRPNFFVNTPDINPVFLQSNGRPGFLIRAALASLLSGLWGIYSGFELCEAAALPGKEEYLDSEKYELRQRDFNQPGNITAEITQLNALRKDNPALASHLGVTFYRASNDNILYFAKASNARDNVVLVAICLDSRSPQECEIELPLWEWGMNDDGSLEAEDLIEGHRFTWHGKRQYLRIDPNYRPYSVWRVTPPRN